MHSKKEVQAYYENAARAYQRIGRLAGYDVGERLAMTIMPFLDGCGADVVLDLGCGSGRLTDLLVERFRLVVGVDISRVGVKIAWKKSRLKGRCNFIVADALHLPFKRECLDAVVMSEVLEHLYSQKQALREANRLLKPRGHFILTTPNRLYRDVGQLMCKFALKSYESDQIVENQLYPAGLRSLVEAFFNIEKEKGVFFTIPFLEKSNIAFLLSLRNRLSEALENRDYLPKIAQHQCLLCSPK